MYLFLEKPVSFSINVHHFPERISQWLHELTNLSQWFSTTKMSGCAPLATEAVEWDYGQSPTIREYFNLI